MSGLLFISWGRPGLDSPGSVPTVQRAVHHCAVADLAGTEGTGPAAAASGPHPHRTNGADAARRGRHQADHQGRHHPVFVREGHLLGRSAHRDAVGLHDLGDHPWRP